MAVTLTYDPDSIVIDVVLQTAPVVVQITEARDAYQLALAEGFIGTRAEWIESLSGVGAPGPSAYQVAVANGYVGTESAWLASLSGVGAPGPSAYQVAVANGYVGTEAAWLASLAGVGSPGPSAYQVAVANGFVGTEADWLTSLIGRGAYLIAVQDGGFAGTVLEWLDSLKGNNGVGMEWIDLADLAAWNALTYEQQHDPNKVYEILSLTAP